MGPLESEIDETFGRAHTEHAEHQAVVSGDLGQMAPPVAFDPFDVAER